MNKRQAKKAFKKKYGVNPNKAEELLQQMDWQEIGLRVAESVNETMRQLAECLVEFAEWLPTALEELTEELQRRQEESEKYKRGEE